MKERVVTVRGGGIEDEDYLDAILQAIDNGVELKRSDTVGEDQQLLCSVWICFITDPLMFTIRWAVGLDAEDYEIRDYADRAAAFAAYEDLRLACAADGVFWSFHNE